jgi:hypothetical protein
MFMGPEGILFALPATFAGSALAQIQKQSLALPAIFSAAVLNVVQVGVGLTQFGPLREASLEVEGLSPAAGSVVAFSFFLYHAAKVLIGFAAISVGLTRLKEDAKALGWL